MPLKGEVEMAMRNHMTDLGAANGMKMDNKSRFLEWNPSKG
jgi:hypothetical protein